MVKIKANFLLNFQTNGIKEKKKRGFRRQDENAFIVAVQFSVFFFRFLRLVCI